MKSIYGTDVADTPQRDFLADVRSGIYSPICRFFDENDNAQDISDWQFIVKIRRRSNDDVVLLECTPENGRLDVDDVNAQVNFNITSQDIETFLGPGLARYEIRADIPNRKNPLYAAKGLIDVQTRIAS